jgi:hypothetical protein
LMFSLMFPQVLSTSLRGSDNSVDKDVMSC